MTNKLALNNNDLLNAVIYIDYENIFEILKRYGANPLDIDFFPVILNKLKTIHQLNIIECIVYSNFEKKPFQGKHQTMLQKLGLQTRHTASNGKNCADLMLTVDSLTTLYKNPNIDVFVIVSSDRDMIPLLKAIKYENKLTYVLSTKFGFNPIVSSFADYHEYLEELFGLKPETLTKEEEPELNIVISQTELNTKELENAKEVARLLYSSNVWKTYETEGNPVTLKGYLNIVSKKIGRDYEQVVKYFELAHYYKYITIYKDQNKGLCIKKGDNYKEIIGLSTFETE